MKKILVINPGSTSTKIAVYHDSQAVFSTTLRHSVAELEPFSNVYDQYDFREQVIIRQLEEAHYWPDVSFDAIMGRGGLLRPIPSGVYAVNDLMIQHLKDAYNGEHASNLGGILAARLSARIPGCRSFICDPVVVDEMQDVARITGLKGVERISIFHALNQKAIAREHARRIGIPYNQLNLIVVHLGGGISVGAHQQGKVIDTNNALHGDGPIAPERAGTLPALQWAQRCFSGDYTWPQIKRMVNGGGGMVSLLGTNSFMEAEKRVQAGDPQAQLVFDAMAYNIAKYIGSAAVTLKGRIDAILLTGGLAHSRLFTDCIIEQVSFLAPCFVYPGEDEMGALAQNALSALNGQEPVLIY